METSTRTHTPTDPSTLRAAREETIDALCREFANDALSLAELERRLTKAREARSPEDLGVLLSDLTRVVAVPVPSGPRGMEPVMAADATRMVPGSAAGRAGEPRPGSHLAVAVLGGTRRAGRWAPPESMVAVAIMGGIELDFREAVLTPGVTEINVFAFWGGVQITVPPEVHVDTRGLAIMGGFEQTSDVESDPPAGAPTIRVNGMAIMAGVEVLVRKRGER
jgi:hypothetical protein